MRYVYWGGTRIGRLLAVVLALLVYFLLLSVEAYRFIPRHVADFALLFGFSSLVALLFLAVGTLVWLYARERRVALLLFAFCFVIMVTFAGEVGSVYNDILFNAIVFVSSASALYLFLLLSLFFPKSYFSTGVPSGNKPGRRSYSFLLGGFVAATTLLYLLDVGIYSIYFQVEIPQQRPDWFYSLDFSFDGLVLMGILATIILSYRRSASLRERQQLRIFVCGVVLAFAPLLALTVLPTIWNPSLGVPGQYSTVTFLLLPLALGYSILRYQILIFDSYIRRAVAWIIGGVSLFVLGSLVGTLAGIFLSSNLIASSISVFTITALLAPLSWWLAHRSTDRLFFSEIRHYRRLLEQPAQVAREQVDLGGASRVIQLAATQVFGTQEVCLYVLDEESGRYHLFPPLAGDAPSDLARRSFIQRLEQAMRPEPSPQGAAEGPPPLPPASAWFPPHTRAVAIIERLGASGRPLLLSEATAPATERAAGLARYITTRQVREFDPLLAPLRAQGAVIALLVLGERGDHGQYAGPDFEALALIEARYTPLLQAARLLDADERRLAHLARLSEAATQARGDGVRGEEEEVVASARAAAAALGAGAQVWRYDGRARLLRHTFAVGPGPLLARPEVPLAPGDGDWSPWFSQDGGAPAGSGTQGPSCVRPLPDTAYAWLPLVVGGGAQPWGVLALTYPDPHRFAPGERLGLCLYAERLAAALEAASLAGVQRTAHAQRRPGDEEAAGWLAALAAELHPPLSVLHAALAALAQAHSLPEDTHLAAPPWAAWAQQSWDRLARATDALWEGQAAGEEPEGAQRAGVSLRQVVSACCAWLRGGEDGAAPRIRVEIEPGVRVGAREDWLYAALLLLLRGAWVVAASRGQPAIAVSALVEGASVRVQLRPAGESAGLAAPAAPDREHTRQWGAGLDLLLATGLIERMGGQVWAEPHSTGEATYPQVALPLADASRP